MANPTFLSFLPSFFTKGGMEFPKEMSEFQAESKNVLIFLGEFQFGGIADIRAPS